VLRYPALVSPWSETDFDVFDGDQNVGRIYLVNAFGGS
jgi:hypothetical protein